jgi:hypothetical protein
MASLDDIEIRWCSFTAASIIGLVSLLLWRRYFSAISDIPGPLVREPVHGMYVSICTGF